MTKKGKSHKGKGMCKTDGQKTSCFVCGRVGHMTKDRWFKDTSKGVPPNTRGRKGKGNSKGKGKNSVNEVTESTVTPTRGTTSSTSQISRITQDDTWDRPHPQNADEEYGTGYVSATIRYREPLHQYKDWYVVRVLVDNCADDDVCSPRDFE